MVQVIFEGLLLGLSSGAYCIGTCLVFFIPYIISQNEPLNKNIKTVLFFMSGRLVSYVGFAALIGLLGENFSGLIPPKLSHISLITVSLLMLFYAVIQNFKGLKFCRIILPHFDTKRMPFILGVFLGLNPCIPFLAGAVRIWTLHDLFLGIVLFLAFFIGASVYILPLFFAYYLNRIERVRTIGLILTLLCGIWFLFVGITGLMKQ